MSRTNTVLQFKNKTTKEATATEKFWAKVLEGWRGKARAQREDFQKLARMYRTMYYPRDPREASGLDFDDAVSNESNYVFAFSDTLVAQVVPPNPAVTITANRRSLERPAKFRQELVNKILRKEKAAAKLWKLCTRAAVWPRSWIKVVWSHSRRRPIFRVINPHYIWYDLNAEDYEDIRYIIEVVPLTRADFVKRLKKPGKKDGYYRMDCKDEVEFGKWPEWLEPDDDEYSGRGTRGPRAEEEQEQNIVRDAYEWTVVYEIFDFRGQKFYHYADGVQRPLFEGDLPYTFIENPYWLLVWNDNLQDLGGMSDTELIYPTVERLNEMQSLEMWHCKTSIPVICVHEGLVDDPGEFMDSYEAIDGPGAVLPVNAKPGVSIQNILGQTPVPTLAPEWARTMDRLESQIEFVLGLPAYARGEVGQSDVATELALTDTAVRTRNARRQKEVYNVIEWMAAAVVSLFQEFMEEGDEIPIRLTENEDETMLTAELMSFGEGEDDPWSYDYESHPFNASELNDVVQLKQFEVFMPVLLQAAQMGHVDMRKLVTKLLELLHMPQLLSDKPPEAPQMPGMMPPGGAGGAEGGPMPGMPTAAQPSMVGGEVMAGAGAQAVPGGLEGGMQPGGGGALGGLASFQQPI